MCIHRTPHYLAICTDNSEEEQRYSTSCAAFCEYHPDFKTSDADAPIDMYGNWTVPCGKGDVNTFNGLNSNQDDRWQDKGFNGRPSHEPRVFGIVFEDKCDSDTFLAVDGQVVNI